MTRSHKYGDKDHAGLAEGSVLPQEHVPKFFAKNGFADVDPKKTKKNGGGKGNWYVPLLPSLSPELRSRNRQTTSYIIPLHTFHLQTLPPPSIGLVIRPNPTNPSTIRGGAGEEVVDEPFNFTNARRRSNSSGILAHPESLKTKFEFNEPEPVFEESMGPEADDDLHKTDTSSSGGSVDGEKAAKDI
ncbi:hypothetical protein B0T19DRAFT_188291 [Cercophora scortea]|uniref:Uncharacterized protein n=1 Tax=Cercophora scortea TaxID=314031 RepID=A0AAE0MEQ1_9PEZI|nr:hypothetical protein B0T19DRAFT_188291 [Cercophora scortea]